MSTFEQVLELIQTLTAEEVAELRARLDEESPEMVTETPKRILGLHAHLGKPWMSDDFWLGDENSL